MTRTTHTRRDGHLVAVDRDARGRFDFPRIVTPPDDAPAPVVSYREAGPLAATVWTRDQINAGRRLETAKRRTKNHQAATLAWWGPPRRTTAEAVVDILQALENSRSGGALGPQP